MRDEPFDRLQSRVDNLAETNATLGRIVNFLRCHTYDEQTWSRAVTTSYVIRL